MFEIVRITLENTADFWFRWLLYSTIALFIGVVLEERADRIIRPRYLLNLDTGYAQSDATRDRWQSGIKTFGLWLTVGAIIAEGLFEFLGARAEGRVRDFSNVMLSAASTRASDAIKQVGDVSILLDRQRKATERFETQATLAEEALKKDLKRTNLDVRARAPRMVSFRDAKIGEDPRLKPFVRQHVHVFDCEGRRPDDRLAPDDEVYATTFELAYELTYVAHWHAIQQHRVCDVTGTPEGIEIVISPRASSMAKDAAKALRLVLHDALAIDPHVPLLQETEIPLGTEPGDPDPHDLDLILIRVDSWSLQR
jgi:hypothetical protein